MARFISESSEWGRLISRVNALVFLDRNLPELIVRPALSHFLFVEDFCLIDDEGIAIMQSFCRALGEDSFYIVMTDPSPIDYQADLGVYPGLEVAVTESPEDAAGQLFDGPGPEIGTISLCFSRLTLLSSSLRWCVTIDRELELSVFCAESREISHTFFSVVSVSKGVYSIEKASTELVSLAVRKELYHDIHQELIRNYGPGQYFKKGDLGRS